MRAFLIGVAHAVPCCSLGTAPCAADRTVNCTGEERRLAPQVALREYCKMGYAHDGAASVQLNASARVWVSRLYRGRTGKGVCKRACACVCMPCATWLRMPARLAALCSFFTRPHLRHCYFNSASRKHKDEHKQRNKQTSVALASRLLLSMHSLTGERRASDLCGFARAEVLWAIGAVGSRSTSGAIRRRMHRRPAARGQRVCNGVLPRALRVVTAGHRRRAAGARRASILAASARVTRSGRALALCNVARCAPTARTANTRAACPGRFAAAAVGACYQVPFRC